MVFRRWLGQRVDGIGKVDQQIDPEPTDHRLSARKQLVQSRVDDFSSPAETKGMGVPDAVVKERSLIEKGPKWGEFVTRAG